MHHGGGTRDEPGDHRPRGVLPFGGPGDPGDRRPTSKATGPLDRAPGERYVTGRIRERQPSPASGGRSRAVLAASAVAGFGCLVYVGLGLLDLGPGLIAVAATVGWATALALIWGGGPVPVFRRRATRVGLVAALAVLAVLAGQLLLAARAIADGGVLGPIDYLSERFGLLAVVDLVAAGLIGGLRAR
jgi:hypothetical protein